MEYTETFNGYLVKSKSKQLFFIVILLVMVTVYLFSTIADSSAQTKQGIKNSPSKYPIVGMSSTASGRGYWLVASDGGIFSFGDAQFYGSTGSIKLIAPIKSMARTNSGSGYTLMAGDGGIFNFGDSQFYGSTSGSCLGSPSVAISKSNYDNGYFVITQNASLAEFGPGRRTNCPPPVQNGCQGNMYAKKIIVSIDLQHLWACEFESEYLNTDITTGAEGIGFGTPTGAFTIYSKERNRYLVGPGYRSLVSYWMPFYNGYGLHDASWRRSFGRSSYGTQGSHGCVNMPPSVAPYVYNFVQVGTKVIVKLRFYEDTFPRTFFSRFNNAIKKFIREICQSCWTAGIEYFIAFYNIS